MGKLKNRGQQGVTLPLQMLQQIREFSKSTGIPISRIIQRAIELYFTKTE